jgi:hypothetical protein
VKTSNPSINADIPKEKPQMKSSKSSITILIAALSVGMIFVASVLGARSNMAAAGAGEPMSSVKPVRGIDVIVEKGPPGNSASRQTNTQGSFTVSDLTPGTYEVSLVCNARCQSMNDLNAGVIQFVLTGAKEADFKRNITKQQLVAGVKFPFEIVARGKEPRYIHGVVSLIK